MPKGQSERGSKKGSEMSTFLKGIKDLKVSESLVQKDGYDSEEEQALPPLTTLSGELEGEDTFPVIGDTFNADAAEAAMTKIQGSAHEGTGTSISSQIQKIIAKELSTPSKKGKIDLQSAPLKEYLEQTVIPIVHQGMVALARERPAAPIEYLAAYFLKHKHRYQQNDQQALHNIDQESKSSDPPTAISGNVPITNTSTVDSLQQTANESPVLT